MMKIVFAPAADSDLSLFREKTPNSVTKSSATEIISFREEYKPRMADPKNEGVTRKLFLSLAHTEL